MPEIKRMPMAENFEIDVHNTPETAFFLRLELSDMIPYQFMKLPSYTDLGGCLLP